jgi:hypothetical protein
MEKKFRNLTISIASLAVMGTLVVFASQLVTIAPPEQQLGGPGFVYTAEYECGKTDSADVNLQTQPGSYATNILVHNPFTQSATVYVKILPATGLPSRSLWLNATGVTIVSNGALEIDCKEITGVNPTVTPFSKGLVSISHPTPIENNITIKQPVFSDESLDVIASYTYLASSVTRTQDSEAEFFNKIVVKVKDRRADGSVTFELFEVIIPAKVGEPISDLKSRILEELRKSGINVESGCCKIVEIISIDFAATGGGGGVGEGVGSSKDVETVKGKFVPYVPLPPTPPTPTPPTDEVDP